MSRTFNYQRGMQDGAVEYSGEFELAAIGGSRTVDLSRGYHGDLGLEVDFRGPQEASVDGQGGSIRGKPVFTIEEAAFQLNRGDGLITIDGVTYESGAEWFGGKGPARNDYYDLAKSKADSDGSLDTLTFGFYESQATLPEPYVFRNTAGSLQIGLGVASGFSAFSPEQRAAAREAIASWDDLIAVTFKETPFQQGDINFMNTTSGPAQASAYLPYDYGVSATKNFAGNNVSFKEISGDVYVATPSKNASNGLLDEGQYGLTTLIHELGHSLGLEHPGNYNFAPGFAVTYENGAEYYQDSNQYSIMSYWDAEETNAARIDWELLTYKYPSTPMVHDVAAIQRVYGADMTTRTGDSTYGFNISADVAGRDSYDFRLTPAPIMTIWDAGGIDTIDVSGFNTSSVINLNPGSYSSAGGFFSQEIPTLAEINARRAAAGLAPRTQATYDVYLSLVKGTFNNGLFTDNIGIAYGVIIENATGGAGDDTLIGNDVANVLNGGAGFDTVSYIGATDGGMTFNVALRTGSGAAAAGDTYISIEAFEGTNFADVFIGSSAADTLRGAGGDDKITGGSGADTLFGGTGNDRLEGGNDDDTLNGDAGNDVLIGGNGADTLNGGDGDDSLDGGNDTDTLNGGAGVDTLMGGNGNDVLNGGAGNDILTGGNGNDIFLFTEVGNDRITDFRRGQDKIDLSDLDANSKVDGLNAFTFIGSGAFSGGAAGAGQLRAYSQGGTNYLAGDIDGDGFADFTIVTGSVLIGQTDLILI